jgi:hypothetical protein
MLKLRMMSIPAALLLAAGTARAQHAPGGATGHTLPPAVHPTAAAPHAAAASWNGTPSKWGGSPPERTRNGERARFGQPIAYIPIAVAAPYSVPAADDPCPPAPDASVEMPIVTTHHEERQLTTIEVYRLQPRFQRP